MPLFKHLVHLLDQTVEDRIRICFVICAFKGETSQRDDRMLIKLVLQLTSWLIIRTSSFRRVIPTR